LWVGGSGWDPAHVSFSDLIMIGPNTTLNIIGQENFNLDYHLNSYSSELDGTHQYDEKENMKNVFCN